MLIQLLISACAAFMQNVSEDQSIVGYKILELGKQKAENTTYLNLREEDVCSRNLSITLAILLAYVESRPNLHWHP